MSAIVFGKGCRVLRLVESWIVGFLLFEKYIVLVRNTHCIAESKFI